MKTSNLSTKKHHNRSHNRTPKLYRWADIGTEALIYFTILWGPWAFGTVHDWAIQTMNFANYSIGALLLTKWVIRYKTGYYPPRWTTQRNGQSTTQPLKRDWRAKAVAALTIYLLGYILLSILNDRASFNRDLSYFEYQDHYINWLPHTYDKASTIRTFLIYLGLASFFWGLRDWVIGKGTNLRLRNDPNEVHLNRTYISYPCENVIPPRFKRLVWCLCINGGLLALVGILQRLDGTTKLLWFYEREHYRISIQSFGPFGYRGNAASYINLLIPITVGFFIFSFKSIKFPRCKKSRSGESCLLLIPIATVLIASQLLSLSRGGLFVFLFLIFLTYIIYFKSLNSLRLVFKFGIAVIFIFIFGFSYYIGLEPLLNRLQTESPWHETGITKEYDTFSILYSINSKMLESNKKNLLFLISNSANENFRVKALEVSLTKNNHLSITLSNSKTPPTFTLISKESIDLSLVQAMRLKIDKDLDSFEVDCNGNEITMINSSEISMQESSDFSFVPNEIFLDNNSLKADLNFELRNNTASGNKSVSDQIWQYSGLLSFNLKSLSNKMSNRIRIYEDGWNMVTDFKWLGCGAGTWSYVYFLYHDADEQWDAWLHSDWLEYYITLGFFGYLPIILFFLLLISCKTLSGTKKQTVFDTSLTLALLGCLFNCVFDFPLQVYSILHLFILMSCLRLFTPNFTS
jgi:hypothetical protein